MILHFVLFISYLCTLNTKIEVKHDSSQSYLRRGVQVSDGGRAHSPHNTLSSAKEGRLAGGCASS